jgi:hypothetical protein
MSGMKPSAIRAKVVTLAGRRSNFWDLGNALLMLRDTSRYTGDFKRTVKNAELNLRQAYYLCEIVEAIGWTKTQVIARGLNKQNLKERLALAEAKGNSTRKLPALMKGETPSSDTRRVVLYLTKKQYGVFERAVVQNGGSIAPRKNLVDKELALMALIEKAALNK